MILPLVLGLDPGTRSGVALLDPAERPRLLLLRVVEADTPDAWAERAFLVMERVADLARSQRRPLVAWCELTPPVGENGWQSFAALCERRGQLKQALADAGGVLAGWESVYPQTWASRLGVLRGKRGDGGHRVIEAEGLVEMPADTLRGLGKATVDASEACLIGCAKAWEVIGFERPIAPKVKAPSKPKRPRVSRDVSTHASDVSGVGT